LPISVAFPPLESVGHIAVLSHRINKPLCPRTTDNFADYLLGIAHLETGIPLPLTKFFPAFIPQLVVPDVGSQAMLKGKAQKLDATLKSLFAAKVDLATQAMQPINDLPLPVRAKRYETMTASHERTPFPPDRCFRP